MTKRNPGNNQKDDHTLFIDEQLAVDVGIECLNANCQTIKGGQYLCICSQTLRYLVKAR